MIPKNIFLLIAQPEKMETIVHSMCYHVNNVFTIFIFCAINFLKNLQEPEANMLFLLGSLQIWVLRDFTYPFFVRLIDFFILLKKIVIM